MEDLNNLDTHALLEMLDEHTTKYTLMFGGPETKSDEFYNYKAVINDLIEEIEGRTHPS